MTNSRVNEVVRSTVDSMTKEMAAICPITGLLVPNGLPPMMGTFLVAKHALAYPENALAIIKNKEYWSTMDKSQKVGLILAVMNAKRHLSLGAESLVIRLAIEARLNNAQVQTFLEFIQDHVLTTKRGYPTFHLDKRLSQYTFLDYINQCAHIEAFVLEPNEPVVTVKIPQFLSSDNQGKKLDKECYEEWLAAAEFLPKEFCDRAKPFIRTLATNPNTTVDKMLTAVEGAALKRNDEVPPEVFWFIETTVEARKKAKALGLHVSLDDIFSGLETPMEAHATSSNSSPSLDLSALDAPVVEEVEKKVSPFAARLAQLKNKGGQ